MKPARRHQANSDLSNRALYGIPGTVPTSALSHSAQEARRHDRDRFLAALYAPEDRREAVFALLAFNAEIARIREIVREPLAGEIRLQWWRDAVDTIQAAAGAGRVPALGHPVLDALAAAISAHGLTHAHFETLFEARRADFAETGFADMTKLTAYAEATSVPLTLLVLEVLAGAESREPGSPVAVAGRHVAVAWALTGLLRAVPFHARQGRVSLPLDALAAAGIARDDILRAKPGAELAGVVRPIAESAHGHIAQARKRRREISRRALPALLPALSAEDFLNRLERAGFDPFDARVERGRAARQVKLAFSAARGAY
jgi:phytoene synthase